MKRYLGIDYGTKRVGLAISHGSLAEPFQILSNDQNLYSSLVKVVEDELVEGVVVGISENEMAMKTTAFAEELRKHIDLPIYFADETLSSNTVEQRLLSAKKKTRSGPIDHYAASVILQEWLDINFPKKNAIIK